MSSMFIPRDEFERALRALVTNTVNLSAMMDLSDPHAAGVIIGRLQALNEVAMIAGLEVGPPPVLKLLKGASDANH